MVSTALVRSAFGALAPRQAQLAASRAVSILKRESTGPRPPVFRGHAMPRPTRRKLSLLILLGFLLPAHAAAGEKEEKGFAPLFDGKTFEGWEGNLDIFRIEDGAIVGGTLDERIPHNEFLCTEERFGDFELRLKFKLVGKGVNAGIQFRSERIPNHHEVKGYQADLGQKYWGALYDESRRRRILAGPDLEELFKVLKPDGWNEYTIRAEGKRIQLWINGHPTVDYTEKDEDIPQQGIIGLQIHGGPPSEAWYKDIRIKKL
jgi:hypothetical protein